jgi:hypothetical protein
MLVLSWGVIFAVGDHQDTPGMIASAVVATLGALIVAGVSLGALITGLALQAYLGNNEGVVGEHTLEITDEGLVEATDVNRTLIKWRSPLRIRETSRYAYIFVGGGSGLVVPLRKAPREGSVGDFLNELRFRIREAQSGGLPRVD